MAFLRAVIRCSGSRNKYFPLNNQLLNEKSSHFLRTLISVHYKSTHAASAIGYDEAVEGKSDTEHPKDPLDLSFNDARAAFKSKTTWEILRAYLVYQMCSSETLVENNMKVCPLPVEENLVSLELHFRLAFLNFLMIDAWNMKTRSQWI